MKKYFFYSLLLTSCHALNSGESERLTIDKTEKVVCKNDSNEIVNKYLRLTSVKKDDKRVSELNIYFENVNGINHWNCGTKYFNGSMGKITGDYRVLEENDSIILLEFYVTKNNLAVNYTPVVFNKQKLQLIGRQNKYNDVSKSKLKKYVEQFVLQTGNYINLHAYDEDNNAALSYLEKGDSLILYLGEEGEGGGRYKLEIPIDSVLSSIRVSGSGL